MSCGSCGLRELFARTCAVFKVDSRKRTALWFWPAASLSLRRRLVLVGPGLSPRWIPPPSAAQAVKDWDSDAAAQACGAGLPGSKRRREGSGSAMPCRCHAARQARSQKLAQEDGGRKHCLCCDVLEGCSWNLGRSPGSSNGLRTAPWHVWSSDVAAYI